MSFKFVSKRTEKAAARGAKRIDHEKLMGCDFAAPFSMTFKTVKDSSGNVTDYKDVTISGYLSTFNGVDRDGETVMPGAFKDTIQDFMANPVLLADHKNEIKSIAGKFTQLQEDPKGLRFTAAITNSPAEHARDIRHKVVNKELRTCSMGGIFMKGQPDERGVMPIHQVALFEGSLTPVPANPDCTFSTRSLDMDHQGNKLAPEDAKRLRTKAVNLISRLSMSRGRKLMDKPMKAPYTLLQEGADPMADYRDKYGNMDPMDAMWGAQRLSANANDMSDWALDQDNDDAHNEAAATHAAISEHFRVLSAAMGEAGHSLTAERCKRMARYHQMEAGESKKHMADGDMQTCSMCSQKLPDDNQRARNNGAATDADGDNDGDGTPGSK